MNKKLIALLAVPAGLVLAMSLTTGRVYAAETSNYGILSPLIQGIIDKFKLNKTEVTSYVQTVQNDRYAERKELRETHLQSLVTAGKLTQAQKDALVKKMDERHTERLAEREEFQKWAQDNGIDLSVVREGMGKRAGKGMMGR